MPCRARSACLLLALAMTAGAVPLAALAEAPKGPSADELQKMEAAVAQVKAAAKPARPRKLLVYSVSWGYFHTAIPYGQAAARLLGEKTGAFEATVSDDPALFEADSLARFDAVFFNNTNNEIFQPADFDKLPADEKAKAAERDERLRKSFAAWLASGRGLAVTHAGVACFRQWPEYGNIIGARFDNHPWGAGSEVTLKIEEPDHPLAQAFKEPLFVVKDEIYQVTDPYSRDALRVLVSIDTDKSNMKVGGINRKDNDFAMTWIKTYGKGRVFYNALGHMHELFWDPVVLQHYLDGLQFALGDLDADAKPRPKTP